MRCHVGTLLEAGPPLKLNSCQDLLCKEFFWVPLSARYVQNSPMKTLLIIVVTATLFGCTTAEMNRFMYGNPHGPGSYVEGITRTYHNGSSLSQGGRVYVYGTDASGNRTLQSEHITQKIGAYFSFHGFTVVTDSKDATHVAYLSYGIDNGTTTYSSYPVIGRTGGGRTRTTGVVDVPGGGLGSYHEETYEMPRWDIVGSRTTSQTQFMRALLVRLFEIEALQRPDPLPILEMSTASQGACRHIDEVIDEMIQGSFQAFPGRNGAVREWSVLATFSC